MNRSVEHTGECFLWRRWEELFTSPKLALIALFRPTEISQFECVWASWVPLSPFSTDSTYWQVSRKEAPDFKFTNTKMCVCLHMEFYRLPLLEVLPLDSTVWASWLEAVWGNIACNDCSYSDIAQCKFHNSKSSCEALKLCLSLFQWKQFQATANPTFGFHNRWRQKEAHLKVILSLWSG